MRFASATLTAALLLAGALPAAAQQVGNIQYSGVSPAVPYQLTVAPGALSFPAAPTPQQLAAGDAYENPAVRSVAQNAYANLASGRLSNVRLTASLEKAWTPALAQTAAHDLASFGTPSWAFVENRLSSSGTVSVYKLTYPQRTLYMTVGVDNNGVVYALALNG